MADKKGKMQSQKEVMEEFAAGVNQTLGLLPKMSPSARNQALKVLRVVLDKSEEKASQQELKDTQEEMSQIVSVNAQEQSVSDYSCEKSNEASSDKTLQHTTAQTMKSKRTQSYGKRNNKKEAITKHAKVFATEKCSNPYDNDSGQKYIRKSKRKLCEPSSSEASKFVKSNVKQNEHGELTADNKIDIEPVPENKEEKMDIESAPLEQDASPVQDAYRKQDHTYSKHKRKKLKNNESFSEEEEPRNKPTKKTESCNRCGMPFDSREKCKEHMMKHTSSDLKCFKCEKAFKTSSNLKRHVQEVHLKILPFSCNICNSGFFKQHWLTQHIQQQHAQEGKETNQLKCGKCDKEFPNQHAFYGHIKCHKIQTVECKDCKHTCNSRAELARHILDMHTPEKNPDEVTCPFCKRALKNQSSLDNHVYRHHKDEVSEEERQRLETSVKDSLTCDVCNKMFISASSLLNHKAVHSSEHFPCTICGKSFSFKGNLKRHIEWHKGEKNYTCPQANCGKSFFEKSAMLVHVRTHTGDKPFICAVCGKAFAQSASLYVHKRMHEPEPSESFQCGVCSAVFHRKSHLKDHIMRCQGTPTLQCDHCDKKFYTKSDLTRHQKTLNGKQYKCGMCNATFSRAHYLADHKNIHTGKIPYQCPHCPLKFAFSYQRRNHIKKDHQSPTSQVEDASSAKHDIPHVAIVVDCASSLGISGDELYRCNHCGQLLVNIDQIAAHFDECPNSQPGQEEMRLEQGVTVEEGETRGQEIAEPSVFINTVEQTTSEHVVVSNDSEEVQLQAPDVEEHFEQVTSELILHNLTSASETMASHTEDQEHEDTSDANSPKEIVIPVVDIKASGYENQDEGNTQDQLVLEMCESGPSAEDYDDNLVERVLEIIVSADQAEDTSQEPYIIETVNTEYQPRESMVTSPTPDSCVKVIHIENQD